MPTSDTAVPATTSDRPIPAVSERDIVFMCPNCQGDLVVDREGAGLIVPCSHCGATLTIPEYSAERLQVPLAPERHFDFSGRSHEQLQQRFEELKHQLKENRSQDTEMRGHVNRATIDLHRLQLKLRKLQDRQAEIDAELAALAERLDSGGPAGDPA